MLDKANLFGAINEEPLESRYSLNIDVPQYKPSDTKPNILELCDTSKYQELLYNIDNSNIPDAEKTFLKLAATRHIVFNYSNIADYYAHSSKETQELMEDSALVILDFDDALAKGYVELNDKIRNIAKASNSYKRKAEKYGLI